MLPAFLYTVALTGPTAQNSLLHPPTHQGQTMLQFGYQVPEQKRIRLIVNSDVANEADDQFALYLRKVLSTRKQIWAKPVVEFSVWYVKTTRQLEKGEVLGLND